MFYILIVYHINLQCSIKCFMYNIVYHHMLLLLVKTGELKECGIFACFELESVFCVLFSAFLHHTALTPSTDPWTVEDLLNEDNITDKVPLQRLQLLGSNLFLSLVRLHDS